MCPGSSWVLHVVVQAVALWFCAHWSVGMVSAVLTKYPPALLFPGCFLEAQAILADPIAPLFPEPSKLYPVTAGLPSPHSHSITNMVTWG